MLTKYLNYHLTDNNLMFSFQEMVSIESFLELVKKRDIGRIKFAIRETNFDINSKDEVSLNF